MVDPIKNKKNEMEEELGEEKKKYNKEDISNSYLLGFQISFDIFSNIRRKIEELGLNDQKEVDIEIRGSKNEPTGVSFEFISFDKTKNNEFYDQNIDYIKKAFLIISLNLELKKEEDFSTIKMIFDELKAFVNKLPNDLFNFTTLFRKKGKKINFDIIQNNDNIELDETKDIGPFNSSLNIGIKTGINVKEIFSENPDHFKNLINALSAIFKFNLKGMHANCIILFVLECIKYFKIGNDTLIPILEKLNDFINLIIMSFYKTEFILEYDVIDLANEISKEICLLYGKNGEGEFQKISQECIDQVKNGIKNILLNDNNLLYLAKNINVDCISLSCVSSLFQSVFAIKFIIPGLYDLLFSDK